MLERFDAFIGHPAVAGAFVALAAGLAFLARCR